MPEGEPFDGQVVADMAAGIRYPNFKEAAAVADPNPYRSTAYAAMWRAGVGLHNADVRPRAPRRGRSD